MKVFCPVLLSGKYFPTKCANRGIRGGQNISPHIIWTDVPPGTASFTLSVIDRHPIAHNWVHWIVVNIDPTVREIHEKASRIRDAMPPACLEVRNSFGEIGWGGPQPPRGSGMHQYEITVSALATPQLSLGPFATLDEYLGVMAPHVIASGSVSGYFDQ